MLIAYFGSPGLYDLINSPTVSNDALSQVSPTGIQILFSEPGLCGGSIQYDLDVNESTGDFVGSIFYNGFDDCETSMSGTIQVSGQLNLQSGEFNHITMLFELLELTEMSSESFVLSGRLEVSESYPTETIDVDLRVRDEDTGKVYWLDGYQLSVLYGFDTQSFEEVTINAGRFYDPDRGYIDVHTQEPVRTFDGELWPSSGLYVAEGVMNASARLIFLSTVIYQVEADVDGDGVYEYETGRVHYPGANTHPVADAGEDAVGNVGCSTTLDGSSSSDADLDTLSYQWTVVISPSGSLSQLTDASSPTPSFTPDVKGVYQFSLSVFDGFDTEVDSVNITAYGDLFCLNNISINPYALTDQYEADVAVGDVNSDGRTDVVALTREAELYVFIQNSSGELAEPVMHAVDNWRAVAIGDVTGDGNNDVVVTTDAGVGVLAQNDTGQLTDMVEYLFNPPLPSPAYSYSLALGDFDNDGSLDAAVLPDNGPVYVFIQNVDGTLGPSSTHETVTTGWNRVLAGDVTGDGLTDIVVSRADSYGFDNIGVLPQSMSGGFETTVYYTIGDLPYTYTYPVVLGDMNNDSRLDLVYSLYIGNDENSEYIGVLPQSNTGIFGAPLFYNIYYPPIIDMAVADVTGDELDDLLILHGTPHTGLPFSPTTVVVLAATGEGTLAPYDEYPMSQIPQSWGGLAVGDVDNDGRNDVVVTGHDLGPSLVVLHGVK
jgi:hypothetical protein